MVQGESLHGSLAVEADDTIVTLMLEAWPVVEGLAHPAASVLARACLSAGIRQVLIWTSILILVSHLADLISRETSKLFAVSCTRYSRMAVLISWASTFAIAILSLLTQFSADYANEILLPFLYCLVFSCWR